MQSVDRSINLKGKMNSQICTSREQSEKLLSLGVKAETADMMWDAITVFRGKKVDEPRWSLRPYYYPQKSSILYDDEDQEFIPAWSLSRLLEIMPKCVPSSMEGISSSFRIGRHHDGNYTAGYPFATEVEGNVFDAVIRIVEWLVNEGYWEE